MCCKFFFFFDWVGYFDSWTLSDLRIKCLIMYFFIVYFYEFCCYNINICFFDRGFVIICVYYNFLFFYHYRLITTSYFKNYKKKWKFDSIDLFLELIIITDHKNIIIMDHHINNFKRNCHLMSPRHHFYHVFCRLCYIGFGFCCVNQITWFGSISMWFLMKFSQKKKKEITTYYH